MFAEWFDQDENNVVNYIKREYNSKNHVRPSGRVERLLNQDLFRST